MGTRFDGHPAVGAYGCTAELAPFMPGPLVVEGLQHHDEITVRRLADTKRMLAASPQYLQRHGRPTTPADLARVRALLRRSAGHAAPLLACGALALHHRERVIFGATVTVTVQNVNDAHKGQALSGWGPCPLRSCFMCSFHANPTRLSP